MTLCRFGDGSSPLVQSSGYENEVFYSLEIEAVGNSEVTLPSTKFTLSHYRKPHILKHHSWCVRFPYEVSTDEYLQSSDIRDNLVGRQELNFKNVRILKIFKDITVAKHQY